MQDALPPGAQYKALNLAGALEFLGDAQAVRDLLAPLVRSLDADLPQIEQLLDGGDLATVARMLHSMKGFVPVFCFDALAQELLRVEKASRAIDTLAVRADVAALLPRLRRLAGEAQDYLRQST